MYKSQICLTLSMLSVETEIQDNVCGYFYEQANDRCAWWNCYGNSDGYEGKMEVRIWWSNELTHAWITQIVHNNSFISRLQDLHGGVAADVASSSGDQHTSFALIMFPHVVVCKTASKESRPLWMQYPKHTEVLSSLFWVFYPFQPVVGSISTNLPHAHFKNKHSRIH